MLQRSPSERELSEKTSSKSVEIGLVVIIAIMVFGALIYLGLQSFLSSQSELYFVYFEYDDYHIHYKGLDYVEVYGSIFNSGNSTATDVQLILTLEVYDWTGADHIETEIMELGDIPAKTYYEVSTKIYYSGQHARIIRHELRSTQTKE